MSTQIWWRRDGEVFGHLCDITGSPVVGHAWPTDYEVEHLDEKNWDCLLEQIWAVEQRLTEKAELE